MQGWVHSRDLSTGVDGFAAPGAPVGLACRLYTTPDGPAGAPTLDQLRELVQRARAVPR